MPEAVGRGRRAALRRRGSSPRRPRGGERRGSGLGCRAGQLPADFGSERSFPGQRQRPGVRRPGRRGQNRKVLKAAVRAGCRGGEPGGERGAAAGGRAGGRGRAAASACVAKGRPRPAGGSGRPAGVCRRGGPARLGWRLAPSPETKPPPVETPPRGRPGRRRSRRCGRGAQVCRRFSGAGGAPPGHAGGLGSQPPRSSAGRLVRRITLKKTRRRLSGFVFSPFALFCWFFFFSSISVSRSRVRWC